MREGGGGRDEGRLQEAAECVERPRALRWQIRPTAEREPAVSAEGKVPPVEFVEKKLRSYCKYQEEASKNKKCAPSPTALLRCKAAAVRNSPPLLSNASHVVSLQGRRDEAEQHVLLHRAGEAGLLHAGGQRCAPLPRRRHALVPAVLRARRGAAGLPADAVCKKLKQKDDAICKLEWGEQLKTVRAPSTARAQGRQPRNSPAAGSAPGSCKQKGKQNSFMI